jgi:hypothetical protein
VDIDLKSVNCESPKIHSDERHKRLDVFSSVLSRRFSSFSETVRFRLEKFLSLNNEDFRLCTVDDNEQDV